MRRQRLRPRLPRPASLRTRPTTTTAGRMTQTRSTSVSDPQRTTCSHLSRPRATASGTTRRRRT
ncbi:hypothetical protein BN1723_018800 [Verticillium longisporum]|uniref:Uncharacterized protein n=1 Tax=Verticillium longisporum TaxID=100787 RepID=A0A0G4N3K2_VERLO|nr:hypothetical protein BN1723_018800 [Verticillium longisporum]